MMDYYNTGPVQLIGSEIHGFRSMEDLDLRSVLEEARTRWLRPNEIHAILCNHRFFTIIVKPVTLPKSGTIILFDRKMFRNFRKDGYSWKKKKDGKTVKEAHEHLKVGNEERIHVYYAHGENNPNFVRRCYWLLEKSLDHIVLVHYRDTQEMQPQDSPVTPVNSYSNSGISDPGSWHFSEEPDSAEVQEHSDRMNLENHEQRLHEINTLEWDELLGPDVPQRLTLQQEGKASGSELQNVHEMTNPGISTPGEGFPTKRGSVSLGVVPSCRPEALTAQDSFGRWISNLIVDSPQSVDDHSLETSNESFNNPIVHNHDVSILGQIFKILEISPGWAFSNEDTKILVVVVVEEGHQPVTGLKLYLVCGNSASLTEVVQAGVYRCLLPAQAPGSKDLYLSLDGNKPISQVLSFEFRAPVLSGAPASSDGEVDWAEYELQMRLARLLFSSSKALSIYSSKSSEMSLKEARAFYRKTSNISESWLHLSRIIEDSKISFPQAKNRLFELILQSRLREWLLEKMVSGDKVSERDEKGHGVIHLCTMLGYVWVVLPFSLSGLSLDYRDRFGWTALHWAACYGKEKMVAALLSAGAKPYLVTDPTSENPGGCTAADLASQNAYDGLAAYLAEKALVAQLNDMTIAGNAAEKPQTASNDTSVYVGNSTEDELNLKETLAAYRAAADAASRIQAAFRVHSLKVKTKEAELSNPEMEARNIVAALRIQHAYKNYEARKKMAAAARIQYRFRAWKMRREFLNIRRQVIRIQAHFRGYQVRKQYRKLVWSVGVLEKAILRWRLKRKGFRGLQVQVDETAKDSNQSSDVEEDFFKASRRQAEDRVERSVTRVQALMHSKQAQEEYRRIKREHTNATLEYQEPQDPDFEMR